MHLSLVHVVTTAPGFVLLCFVFVFVLQGHGEESKVERRMGINIESKL